MNYCRLPRSENEKSNYPSLYHIFDDLEVSIICTHLQQTHSLFQCVIYSNKKVKKITRRASKNRSISYYCYYFIERKMGKDAELWYS